MTAPLSILVTGTSSGFGKRTAKTLARGGHRVFASMRGIEGKNGEAAKEMRRWAAENDVTLDVIELDITDQATIDDAIRQVLSAAGRIDVVVNNASSATAGFLEAFSLEEVRQSFETVAFGALRVDKAVLPAMRRQRSGMLVHVSSAGGRIIVPFVSPYTAAKAALEAFAEEFAFELAPFGIESVIVEPGSFPTEGVVNGTAKSTPAAEEISKEYGDLAAKPQQMLESLASAFGSPDGPDPQQVADAIADLVALPAGRRPLRTVVGTVVTAGLRELNQQYDKSRHELLSSLGLA